LPPGLKCQELILNRCGVERLPPDLHVSARMEAQDCLRLREIPPLRVDELDLRRCAALERLPNGLLVRRLDVGGCTQLAEVPPGAAGSLEHLNVSGCVRLSTLPAELTNLLDLDISGCTGLTSLPEGIRVWSWIELAETSLSSLPSTLDLARLFWRGIRVPYRVVFEPATITLHQIVTERNQELRRVLLERMGLERFVQLSHAQVLDRDEDPGGLRQLLRIRFEDEEDIVCVVVHCPSTGHRYVLRVPPHMRSCREAIAWTAGYENPADYQPLVET
jgi:hypothetical protein